MEALGITVGFSTVFSWTRTVFWSSSRGMLLDFNWAAGGGSLSGDGGVWGLIIGDGDGVFA